MKLSYNYKSLELYSENNFEKKILSSKYLKTKLAYTIVNNPINGLKVIIKGNRCAVNLDENKAFISEYLSKNQMGYMLRIIIDSYVLSKNALPLHSSMISIDSKSGFFFGGTNCGKTIFSNYIKNYNSGYKIIGDDHVIVANKGIVGNRLSRIRSIDNESELYLKNSQYLNSIKKYFIFDIDINDKINNYKILNSDEYMENDLSYVLKYLVYDFDIGQEVFKINEFIDYEVNLKYLLELRKFIDRANAIIKIRGSIEYVTKFINSIFISK
ncbi:hypothetical protein [Clostridium grantii]|uniref:Uncharacterized protein n=1 Tax=Clostridium grantii DSM 8605 TaxID=1121316 RepID=A0A1M5RBZ4_9CLOT|nr:hypothetical protein [Clostridium grantii]SHH23569.1 hypothetical protein SAMN02745207_00433 [Clostridium grantii DSM 8605]